MKILNETGPIRLLRNVRVGADVMFFGFVNAYECELGAQTKVGPFVEIQKGVRIGARCKISSHSFLCEGVELADEVFLGHGVLFTNDKYPRATNPDGSPQTAADWMVVTTKVGKGASIGSGAVILCGITIGDHAMVGAGAVVTKDVPNGATVAGCPARCI
ncbi:acyltransferase [Nibricoccus sp. IMCC34717]|uniref:acyltransferase n=1 Tax=Nibricoccus sp. IMCC34717 TaxID=3034021 RepID=UPI00384AEBA2